jgi:class 3 adenylate cyclase/tetratricopeptide (TPR) repeat protein
MDASEGDASVESGHAELMGEPALSGCGVCGTQNLQYARFCLNCGAPLEAPATVRETRKTVSILFIDLAGSTTLAEDLDPEAVRTLLTRYFAVVRTAIEAHGGTVEKFIGDAAVAVFGVPVLHEDDALRAVRAASSVRAALTVLNDQLAADGRPAIHVRTAINTGPVIAGDPRAGGTFVSGDAVNVAARLQQSAAVDNILLGASTARLVRDHAVLEPLPPMSLRGRVEAMDVFRLVELRADGLDVGAQDVALVGRPAELALAKAIWERVGSSAMPHWLTIAGPPGIGKSRLLRELRGIVRQDGVEPLIVRCREGESGGGRGPLADLARQLVDALGARDDGNVETLRALALSEAIPEEEWLPAVRHAIGHLAEHGRVHLEVDDVQWADEGLRSVLDDLTGGELPVLIACSVRSEVAGESEPGSRPSARNAVALQLEGLSPDDCGALIDELAPGDGALEWLDASTRSSIVGACDGNPLFIEETLALLWERGASAQAGDRVPTERVPLAPTIEALLAARVDTLPPEERAVLAAAAVIGPSCTRPALADLVEGDTPAAVRSLVRRDMLRSDSHSADPNTLRFRHNLMRAVVEESVPRVDRARLHEQHAAWLEHLEPPDALGAAQHLAAAVELRSTIGLGGEGLRALRLRATTALRAAGRSLFAAQQFATAATQFEHADALDRDGPAGERLQANLLRAEAMRQTGAFDDAEALLGEVERGAQAAGAPAVGATARLLHVWASSTTNPVGWIGRVEAATAGSEEPLRTGGDRDGLAVLAALRMEAGMLQGRVADAERAAREAIGVVGEDTDTWQLLRRCRTNLAELALVGPMPVPLALLLCEQLRGDAPAGRRLRAGVLGHVAVLEALRGDDAAARAALSEAGDLVADLDLFWPAIALLRARGEVAAIRDDLDEAADHWLSALDRLQERRASAVAARLAARVARVGALGGGPTEIAERAGSAPTADPDDVEARAGRLRSHALTLSSSGRTAEAIGLADEALIAIRATEWTWATAESLADAAVIVEQGGDQQGAENLRREAAALRAAKGITAVSRWVGSAGSGVAMGHSR